VAHAFTDTSVPRGDAAPPALQAELQIFERLIAELAAGNRVTIKMSEIAPATHAVPKRLLVEVFDEDPVAVITRHDPVGDTALRIARGKSVDGGQIYISPDYPRVPRESVDAFVTGVLAVYPRFYGGRSDGNPQAFGAVVANIVEFPPLFNIVTP